MAIPLYVPYIMIDSIHAHVLNHVADIQMGLGIPWRIYYGTKWNRIYAKRL